MSNQDAATGALKTGTYTKGDQTRLVETQADAVAAVFDGFSLDESTEGDVAPADETPSAEPDTAEPASTYTF